MSRKTPDVWMEVTQRAYPAGTPSTLRVAKRAMAYPTLIEGRVLRAGGWSTITHALADWRGDAEAGTFSATCNDADGRVRALAAAAGRTAYAKAETAVKLLSEAGRKAALAPRIIHRGYLARAPQPQSHRLARLESVGVLGSPWFRLDPESVLQSVRISRAHLEAAGILNTPQAKINKPYNIVVGENSDYGMVAADGGDGAVGVVPCDDIGDMSFTAAHVEDTSGSSVVTIPPPVLAGVVVGTPGGKTYSYQVTMLVDGAETAGSNVVTISNAPNVLDASNYVRLTWTAPTGWEAIYAARAIAFRVCGREASPPVHYLDLMNNGGTFVDPEYEYHDDHDHDVEKLPGAPAVGTATAVLTTPGDPTTVTDSSEWGVIAVCLGYTEVHQYYGSDRADGTQPKRVQLDPDDAELMTPDSASWPYPDPWIEVGTGAEQVRLTAFFARGVLLKHHREGMVTFAVNACGMTDTGDDAGVPITEASAGWAWVINELLLKDGGRGYRTGAFWPLEEFADGTPIIDTATLDRFQAKTVEFIGGRGYQMSLCLTEDCTYSQFEDWFNTTFTAHSGAVDNGQVGLWLVTDDADLPTTPHYRQHIEIAGALPDPVVAEDEVENRIAFQYAWHADQQEFRGDPEVAEDSPSPSQDIYGVREAVVGGALGLRCTADRLTARNSMGRRLQLGQVAPVYQDIPLDLVGVEQALGTAFRVTHDDGLVYVDAPFFTVRKAMDVNGPNMRAVLTGRAVDMAARWAEDAMPNWDSATALERATFMFWSDDDDTVGAGDDPAPEWG